MQKPKNYWTIERCVESARPFTYIKEFRESFPVAYAITLKRGWREAVMSHLLPHGNEKLRYVYVLLNVQHKEVYVGLSVNPHRRFLHHKVSGVVDRFSREPTLKVVSGLLPADVAQSEESEHVEMYRQSGYTVLNQAKCGALGCREAVWENYQLYAEARKYETRSQFRESSSGAYQTARNRGILESVCSHMRNGRKRPVKWPLNEVRRVSKLCDSLSQFRKTYPGAYEAACRNRWFAEVIDPLRTIKPSGYWSKEKAIEEASKFNSKAEFRKGSPSCYAVCNKMGWVIEFETALWVGNNDR